MATIENMLYLPNAAAFADMQSIGLAVAAVVGTLVTVITYSAASGGGRYFLAHGAIIFGLLAFLQGLVEWRKNRSPWTGDR